MKILGHSLLPVLIGLLALAVVFIVLGSLLHRRQNRSDWGSPGMYGVVGRMGGGKSYLMSWIGYQALQRGRPVYSNFALQGAYRVSCWADVLDIPAGDPKDPSTWPVLLLDEIHLWWGRESWRAPGDVMSWASQVRKIKQTVLWASQHEGFVSTRLLRLTFGIWTCVRYRRGHQYTLFDGATFSTPSKRQRLSRMYVARSAFVMAAYDTNEIVAGSMEWGDGQGFEQLTVRRRTVQPNGGGPGPAQRSARPVRIDVPPNAVRLAEDLTAR